MSDDLIAEVERSVAQLMADDHPAATAAEAYAPNVHVTDAHVHDAHTEATHADLVHGEPEHLAEVQPTEAHGPETHVAEASAEVHGEDNSHHEALVTEPEHHEAVAADTHSVEAHDDQAPADAVEHAHEVEVHAEPAAVSVAHEPEAHHEGGLIAEVENLVEPVAAAIGLPVHAAEAQAAEANAPENHSAEGHTPESHGGEGHGRLEALAAAAVVGGLVAAAEHVMSRPSPEEAAASHSPAAASPPAETTRSTMSNSITADSGRTIDPMLAGFDHIVALGGYVLLFASVFMLGVPALASLALAYAHGHDSHLVARTHFKFQIRIFWTAVLLIALGIGAGVVAGGTVLGKLFGFAQEHLPAVSGVMAQAHMGGLSGAAAGGLVFGAVGLFVLAVLWTLFASVFGFLRLLGNRPIGHLPKA